MKRSSRFQMFFLCVLCGSVVNLLPLRAADAPALYANDFEKAAEGDVPPADMVVLSGSFAVKKVDGNKVLELPGDPLDAFGVLFGPEEQYLSVQAKLYGTTTGRRFPEMGVGLGDSNGYKLWLMPATGELQLIKGEEVMASMKFEWKSGTWTTLRLECHKGADGKTVVEGKAWAAGAEEPKDWQIKFADEEDAPKGRPSIWGSPYSSTPIRFDDLVVMKGG